MLERERLEICVVKEIEDLLRVAGFCCLFRPVVIFS
jgi:hypothetical protein